MKERGTICVSYGKLWKANFDPGSLVDIGIFCQN